MTPSYNFEMDSNKTLLIPEGSELNIEGITVTNSGNVYVDGALTGTMGGDGNVYYSLIVSAGSTVLTVAGGTENNSGSETLQFSTYVCSFDDCGAFSVSDGLCRRV